MTPEERDRLTRVEVQLTNITNTLERVEGDVKDMKIKFAKAGGVMIALTMIGAFIGWVVSQVKGIWGLV